MSNYMLELSVWYGKDRSADMYPLRDVQGHIDDLLSRDPKPDKVMIGSCDITDDPRMTSKQAQDWIDLHIFENDPAVPGQTAGHKSLGFEAKIARPRAAETVKIGKPGRLYCSKNQIGLRFGKGKTVSRSHAIDLILAQIDLPIVRSYDEEGNMIINTAN